MTTTQPSLTSNIGEGVYTADANRYHLYVGLGCPFAHRAHMSLNLKGLDHVIGLSITDPQMSDNGWLFSDKVEGATIDHCNGFPGAKELYMTHDPSYTGRYTVPVLWDTKTKTIVNNESAQILRIFNSQFNNIAKYPETDLYPAHLHQAIADMDDFIRPTINFGVYSIGSAKTQEEYETASSKFFAALDKVDDILSKSRYLVGDTITEADIKLFATIIRFDVAYYGIYKANYKMVKDYPHLGEYVKELYQNPMIRPTVNFDHIKKIYYLHPTAPTPKIVPVGPPTSHLEIPHIREQQILSSSVQQKLSI
eukprot:gene2523-2884_t